MYSLFEYFYLQYYKMFSKTIFMIKIYFKTALPRQYNMFTSLCDAKIIVRY